MILALFHNGKICFIGSLFFPYVLLIQLLICQRFGALFSPRGFNAKKVFLC
jgi:hypothetical protein